MDIQDSPQLRRFEEDDIDLTRIEALSSEEVRSIWYSYIPNVDHLMKIKVNDDMPFKIIKDVYVCGENDEETKLLEKELSFFKDKRIIIMWGPVSGIRIDFDYFLESWDDFLYLDDDNVIICDSEFGKLFVQLFDEHFLISEKEEPRKD